MKKKTEPQVDLGTKEAAVEAIAEIGRRRRECVRIETQMNDELATVKQRYEAEAEPHQERIKLLKLQVQAWCQARRDELTQQNKVRTVAFPSGEVRWRLSQPKVIVRNNDAVVECLRRLHLDHFVRSRDEVNKEAIMNDPKAAAGIKGITIHQDETFSIVPFESQLEEVV